MTHTSFRTCCNTQVVFQRTATHDHLFPALNLCYLLLLLRYKSMQLSGMNCVLGFWVWGFFACFPKLLILLTLPSSVLAAHSNRIRYYVQM